MKVGIVAGEASGDYLGGGLITELRLRFPDVEFVGIGGPRMEAAGMRSLYPMNRISIMGLDELLSSLIDILRIRRSLFRFFSQANLALFVGIDVPDFNLGLERKLRRQGITTVHYVSPTVWAWRGYRIRKIKRAVSHMLALFPFEAEYYRRHRVPVTFVGHPIADEIDPQYDKTDLRDLLHVGADGDLLLALLPGSRMAELRRLGDLFVNTAKALHARIPTLQFVAPFANAETMHYFSGLLEQHPGLPVTVVEGRSRQALAASDVALLASGTAALEAALLKVPMIVAYRGSWLSYSLVKMLAHVEYFSMPNNLLEDPIVPELIQSRATVDNLVTEIRSLLEDPVRRRAISSALSPIASSLRCNADQKAADAVSRLLVST